MNHSWRWWTPLSALAALSLTHTGSSVHAEDERADLKVELVGLPLSSTQREVSIRISNVSTWWANETQLTIETVSPGAPNVKKLAVENLDPGQSVTLKYTLGADCSGHVIKAEVTPAKNYAGVPEGNLANNRVQQQVCPAPGAGPSSGGAVTKKPRGPISQSGAGSNDTGVVTSRESGPIEQPQVGVEVLRPVPVSVVLDPIRTRQGTHRFLDDSCEAALESTTVNVGSVGWFQDEDVCAIAEELALQFDLRGLPRTGIDSASLTFGESILNQESPGSPGEILTGGNSGQDENRSCVTRLGRASRDWSAGPIFLGVFPADIIETKIPFGSRQWLVTSTVSQWLAGDKPNYGFVLRGQFDQLEATESSSCWSHIFEPKLTVIYTVGR